VVMDMLLLDVTARLDKLQAAHEGASHATKA